MAAFATTVASADAGGDEYTLNLPSGSNTNVNGSATGGHSSTPSSSVSDATATPPTTGSDTATQTEATTDATSGGGSNASKGGHKPAADDSNGSGSKQKPRGGLVGGEQDQAAPSLGSGSGSDGGGIPIFLIAIAVVAAACVGVAIWRMRRLGPGHPDTTATTEIDPGTQSL